MIITKQGAQLMLIPVGTLQICVFPGVNLRIGKRLPASIAQTIGLSIDRLNARFVHVAD